MSIRQETKIHPIQWLLPIFFGIIGGVIFWAINKDTNPDKARTGLILGIGLSAVSIALYALMALTMMLA